MTPCRRLSLQRAAGGLEQVVAMTENSVTDRERDHAGCLPTCPNSPATAASPRCGPVTPISSSFCDGTLVGDIRRNLSTRRCATGGRRTRCATAGWSVPGTKQRSASATARCWSRRRCADALTRYSRCASRVTMCCRVHRRKLIRCRADDRSPRRTDRPYCRLSGCRQRHGGCRQRCAQAGFLRPHHDDRHRGTGAV